MRDETTTAPFELVPSNKTTPSNPDAGGPESDFRQSVRDVLNMDWSTSDAQIIVEVKRLKKIEHRVTMLAHQTSQQLEAFKQNGDC